MYRQKEEFQPWGLIGMVSLEEYTLGMNSELKKQTNPPFKHDYLQGTKQRRNKEKKWS